MNTDADRESETLAEGAQYDSRHLVWEAAHQLGSPIYRLRKSLILSLLPEPGSSLYFLDVGCGTGDYARVLLERGHRVDAIDISESAVKEAVKRVPEKLRSRFRAVVGDFSKLNHRTLYDYIICSEVLEHVREDESLLNRLHALLLPQGNLIISVPADPALWSQDDAFSGHVRRYTRDELVTKLERAGFIIKNLWSYGFPILWVYTWLKINLFGETINLVSDHKGRKTWWMASLTATVVNALVWPLDRRLLFTNRGVGFVVRCRKA